MFEKYFNILSKRNDIIDISNCIDLAPVLFAFSSLFYGATFTGTNRLKIKESDRANAMALELKKVNVNVEILDDKVIVHKGTISALKEPFSSHNDHRIVMALSLFSSIMDIKINDIKAINKSYPNYFKVLESLGVRLTYENW